MAASVSETMTAINDVLRGSGTDYSCKTVSWDDVERGTVGGALSCLGANITDTRLWAKSGQLLYTVRSDNWNEKMGSVSAHEVALMSGGVTEGSAPKPTTLADFLNGIGKHGAYAGLSSAINLSDAKMDAKVSIRFQTTFLPVADEVHGALEFAPEMYSYQTRSDSDPKNLLLLCTTQGSAVQQDGAGANKLFHHAVDPTGKICRYWFEAERSKHQVGGAQVESADEKAEALKRGKAVSAVIGTKAMGTRFNALMTIQVPLEQKNKPTVRSFGLGAVPVGCFAPTAAPKMMMMGGGMGGGMCGGSLPLKEAFMMEESAGFAAAPPMMKFSRTSSMRGSREMPQRGTANAARVSRGSLRDKWPGLSLTDPGRDQTQHVTVTVVLYNTVAGGVPSVDDVKAAVEDMEQLYAACGWKGRLASTGADFMKKELTVNELAMLSDKVATQPYKPESLAPVEGDVFPVAIAEPWPV